VHLVLRSHFRSRDKDGGYTIRSTIAENPMMQANFTVLCVLETELLLIEVLHCGNRDFRRFLLLLPWPWWFSYTNLTRIPWKYTWWAKMTFLRWGYRKLSSDHGPLYTSTWIVNWARMWPATVLVYGLTDRQTHTHDRNYVPRRFAGG